MKWVRCLGVFRDRDGHIPLYSRGIFDILSPPSQNKLKYPLHLIYSSPYFMTMKSLVLIRVWHPITSAYPQQAPRHRIYRLHECIFFFSTSRNDPVTQLNSLVSIAYIASKVTM